MVFSLTPRHFLLVISPFLISVLNQLYSGSTSFAVEAFTLQMGLLKVGVPKTWDESKKDLRYIRNAGVRQFISTYNRVKDLKGDELLFGDEVEYGVFILDPANKKIRLSLRAKEIMDQLNENERLHTHRSEGAKWVPEYGSWMVEATPNAPYRGFANDLLRVERNMRLRRKRMLCVLADDEIAPTVSTFPLLGALGSDGTVPASEVGGSKTLSAYIGDAIINPHPRFGTLTANIRQRRGEKVYIGVPLFQDVNTPEYKDLKTAANLHGCCGGDSQQLWRYGRSDAARAKYGDDFVVVGCSMNSAAFAAAEKESDDETRLCKWIVNVESPGCKGLFYRSAPNVIAPDADWPRNGDILFGSEIPNIPGWIRLQNGYYLPMHSDDGSVRFLQKVSTEFHSSTEEKRKLGASTPLFRSSNHSLPVPPLHDGAMGQLKAEALMQELSKVSLEELKPAVVHDKSHGNHLERVRAAIHMDAMAFGMGCCCLQVTFQAQDVDESRYIFDQLAVLAPILMALTASTPILKGRIADTDARWGIISESVDDRTPVERGINSADSTETAEQPELAGKGMRRIYKSRYDSISTYIYQGCSESALKNRVLNMYNDLAVPIDESMYKDLRDAGIDPALSQHIAHLFIRDPLVVFSGAVEEIDDETQTEHFESIQSTNWQTVRWKPPPPRNDPNDPHIGWRTEFRSMEMQLTDVENAAFVVFVVLVTRVILAFDLNLYIPLSRVDANMNRAHSRSAYSKAKFFFRRHLAPLEEGDDGYGVRFTSMFTGVNNGTTPPAPNVTESFDDVMDDAGVSLRRKQSPCAMGSDEENSYEEMTMAEIMTGKGNYFPGLIPLVYAYLDYIQCDEFTFNRVSQYLELIEKRSKGELLTPATWMRNFVRGHPSYKGDSVVSEEIAYDLMVACKEIGEGKRHEPTLLGDLRFKPISTDGAYDVKLDAKRVQNSILLEKLSRYTHRKSFFDKGSGI